MVSLENLLLYIPLAALLVMLPGPDFALIVRTSLTEGRSSGQAAACGVGLVISYPLARKIGEASFQRLLAIVIGLSGFSILTRALLDS